MRKLKFAEFGGLKTSDTDTVIECPNTYTPRGFDACVTRCAWFSLVENYGSPVTKNVCKCGDKIIGRLV